jgi:hypothetical protein
MNRIPPFEPGELFVSVALAVAAVAAAAGFIATIIIGAML